MWKKKQKKDNKKINWLKGERQLEKTQKEKRQKGYKKTKKTIFTFYAYNKNVFLQNE